LEIKIEMKSSVRNSAYTKLYNRKLIMGIIHREPVSRAELARKTGLTRAAVSIIVDELISDGIVMEKGVAEAELGRKPVLLDINPDSYYAFGLNISRGKCSLGIVNLKGELKARKEINLLNALNADEALNIIIKEIKEMPVETDIAPEKLLGLGISTPGPVDVFSGTILNPPNFDMWKNVSITAELKKEFSYNILLENNSVALALAEKNYGLGKKFSNFILIVVDNGIGSGVVINNRLYRGFGGFGGEIGHTTINVNGERCSCGNIGCLELYASIPVAVRRARKHDPAIISWSDIVDRAESGDKDCLNIIEEEAWYLSSGIVNAVNILEIEAVVLTGDISYRHGLILDGLCKYVNERAITRNVHRTGLYISGLVNDADVIAAATTVIDSFIHLITDRY